MQKNYDATQIIKFFKTVNPRREMTIFPHITDPKILHNEINFLGL
jgi:hypothetical protein